MTIGHVYDNIYVDRTMHRLGLGPSFNNKSLFLKTVTQQMSENPGKVPNKSQF